MNANREKVFMSSCRSPFFKAICTIGFLAIAGQSWALDVTGTPSPVTGNASWFYGLGAPYGGCGMPQESLETQDFVALNVYNTPGTYEFYTRPLTGADLSYMGFWNNGRNCGRWVEVTIGDYCTGVNDGAQKSAFCRNGSWVSDKYNGATLNMLVADSCGDANGWCRDDPYHLDLSRASLNRFIKNGVEVADMDPDRWNNRHITWKFIPAPNYSGDIQIGFLQGAQTWWAAIVVSKLANGIHGVEYYSGGAWTSAAMDGDMGQAFIIKPLVPGGTKFQIRVRDVTDSLINDGRVYTFSLPDSCVNQCSQAYTKITYSTDVAAGDDSTPTEPTDPTDPTPTSGSCTATYKIGNSWSGGHQAEVTVKAGSSAINGWAVTWNLASGQTIQNSWNGVLSLSGSAATMKGSGWNASLAANGTATFGLVVSGGSSAPTVSCTSY